MPRSRILALVRSAFLTPARLFRTRAARLGVDATRLDEDDVRRTMMYAMRQSFYDVLLAQALCEVAGEQRAVLRQVLAADSVRLRDGDVPAQHVVCSELELAPSDAAFARAPVDTAGLQGVALRERPDLQRARASLAAAKVLANRTRLQIETDAATALDQNEVTRGLAERYEGGLLAKARGAVQTARYAYRAGTISQLELLDALRTDADTRADYHTAVHDYWLGAFAVERASGVGLAGADTAAGLVAPQ